MLNVNGIDDESEELESEEENIDEEELQEPVWTDEPEVPRTPFTFTGPSPGPVYPVQTPLECLEQFITPEIVDFITCSTNRYLSPRSYVIDTLK
jgi:hypothetical protein